MINEYENTRRTLIERVSQQPDEQSWKDFSEIYRMFIYSIIRKMGLSEMDAEDLTQSVMLLLWEKMPELDLSKIQSFRSWVATITRNLVVDFFRKNYRDKKRIERVAGDQTHDVHPSISDPELEIIADQQWRIHITNLALDHISSLFSENAITIFRMSLAGKSRTEISMLTGVTEASVSRLKTRVKMRLIDEIQRLKAELGD